MSGFQERENKRKDKKSVFASMLSDEAINLTSTDNDKIIIASKEKEETRNKRVNLVVKPSVYAMASKKCKSLNISINECINQFLEKWTKSN